MPDYEESYHNGGCWVNKQYWVYYGEDHIVPYYTNIEFQMRKYLTYIMVKS